MFGCGGTSKGNGNTAGASSGGSGGGAGGIPGSACGSSGTSTTNCPSYTSCVETSCTTQLKACYGAGYAGGNYSGGACSAYVTCTQACACNSTCIQACSQTAECSTCLTTWEMCAQNACATQFNQCLSAALDAGPGSHTCADLSACCAQQPANMQSDCVQVANGKIDLICNSLYSALSCQ